MSGVSFTSMGFSLDWSLVGHSPKKDLNVNNTKKKTLEFIVKANMGSLKRVDWGLSEGKVSCKMRTWVQISSAYANGGHNGVSVINIWESKFLVLIGKLVNCGFNEKSFLKKLGDFPHPLRPPTSSSGVKPRELPWHLHQIYTESHHHCISLAWTPLSAKELYATARILPTYLPAHRILSSHIQSFHFVRSIPLL